MTLKWIKSGLKFVFFLSLGLTLIWYSVHNFSAQDIEKLMEMVGGADKLTILYCIFIVMLSHFIRSLRWQMMIMPLGQTPRLSNVFYAVLTGFFFNLIFPRLGEIMKCSLIGKYEKISVDKLVGTMVAERIIDLCCLILVIILTIITQLSLVGDYTQELINAFSTKFKMSLVPILIFSTIILLIVGLVVKYLKNSNLRWVIKIKTLLSGVLEGLMAIMKMKHKAYFLLYTIGIWFLYLASIRVGFPAIAGLAHLGWVPSLTILTFGSFAMIATQGGIGAYQLAVQKTIGLYGINALTGLAFGWLLWAVQTILMLVTGPISLLLLYLQRNKNNNNKF
jgi:uncharacterized protein (TIRG00374 family)